MLQVMLANSFCLSRVSSQRPEITLHQYLWKILFIKSLGQMRMKAKAWRQSFTCAVVSGTLKASTNINTPLFPITSVNISPGKELQPALGAFLRALSSPSASFQVMSLQFLYFNPQNSKRLTKYQSNMTGTQSLILAEKYYTKPFLKCTHDWANSGFAGS